jgi:hypothetical protein
VAHGAADIPTGVLLGVTVSNFDRMPINAADKLPLFDTASPIVARAEPTADAAPEGAHC